MICLLKIQFSIYIDAGISIDIKFNKMPHSVVKKKIVASGIFNCNDLSDFVASIVKVFPYEGVSKSRFYLCEYEGVRFLTKLCHYYKNMPELYERSEGTVPTVDAEIKILHILMDKFTATNLTPCILEIVYSKVCTDVSKLTPGSLECERLMMKSRDFGLKDSVNNIFCRFNAMVKEGLAHDKCAFLVLDRCDITLEDFLLRNISIPVNAAIFKSLLFQIVHCIWVINKVYKKFRHYDLHTENIMLKFDSNYKFRTDNPKYLVFTIDGETYSIPYFGIIPKIIDFGFSIIPEEGVISVVYKDPKQMYLRSDNDLLFLYYHINIAINISGGDKLGRIDKILQSLDPSLSYVHYNTSYIREHADKIPSYDDMMKNKIWDEYKGYKPPKNQIYNEYTAVEEIK